MSAPTHGSDLQVHAPLTLSSASPGPQRVSFPATPSPRRYHSFATLLLLAAAGLHVAYLAVDCPLDLAPDEAHYWDWSRHLDWSYYSKGPLVAYLIRGSCALTGPVSQRLTGSQMLAVRLPAVLCGSLLLASLYILTLQVYRQERQAMAVVVLGLTLPPVAVGSSLMTIDAPFLCCWGWALVAGHRAVFRGSAWAWPLTGLLVGLGILAKYTMVLWLPAFGLFLLTSRTHRPLLVRPGIWALVTVVAVCCSPILIWNIQHDWVGLWHVGGQAGMSGANSWRWFGPFAFLGVQAALLLGFWFVAWTAVMIANRPGRAAPSTPNSHPERSQQTRYLWWMSALVFGVFFAFSLKTAEEPNWPLAAYLSGFVLTVAWLGEQVRLGRRWPLMGATAAGLLGLALTTFLHQSSWLRPLLDPLCGLPTAEHALPLRRLDPTCRLRGWRTLSVEVDRLRANLRKQGIEPVLAGGTWTLPGELAFYCEDHPTVYCLGPALGDRHSQYDLWRPNPLSDPGCFTGRTVLFVGEVTPMLHEAFEQVGLSQLVTHREEGRPIAQWTVTVCRGFRGFPQRNRCPTRY